MLGKTAWLGAVAALVATAAVLAQDVERDKPLLAPGPVDTAIQCEKLLASKDYLKGSRIVCKADAAGKLTCDGEVPSKAHACAVFLTCMSQEGVREVDLSRLKIADAPKPPGATPLGTDVKPGLAKEDAKAIRIYAIVVTGPEKLPIEPDKKTPNDVIVIDSKAKSSPSTTPSPAPHDPDLLPPKHEGIDR
jgi:hypothetical protein